MTTTPDPTGTPLTSRTGITVMREALAAAGLPEADGAKVAIRGQQIHFAAGILGAVELARLKEALDLVGHDVTGDLTAPNGVRVVTITRRQAPDTSRADR